MDKVVLRHIYQPTYFIKFIIIFYLTFVFGIGGFSSCVACNNGNSARETDPGLGSSRRLISRKTAAVNGSGSSHRLLNNRSVSSTADKKWWQGANAEALLPCTTKAKWIAKAFNRNCFKVQISLSFSPTKRYSNL